MRSSALPAIVQSLAGRLHLVELARSSARAALISLALFAIVAGLEWLQGHDRPRYWSRSFFNDTVYTLFYQGQFYTVFIFSAVASAIEPHFASFRLNLLAYLPAPLAFVCWWLALDFMGYWIHRWQHTSRWLWAFHRVHHGPAQLTFLTSNRVHLGDQLMVNTVLIVPLLMLGIPPKAWIGITFAQAIFEALQHSALDWRFGPLYPVVVSPVFHAIHHSADPRHHDRNFAKILSLWDVVFGTAIQIDARPVRFGLGHRPIPESLVQQFLDPFRFLRPAKPASTDVSADTDAAQPASLPRATL